MIMDTYNNYKIEEVLKYHLQQTGSFGRGVT